MPIEEIFLSSSTQVAKEEEEEEDRFFVVFPREREREKTHTKKGKGARDAHRHFDASGRLPADFHVEEHDWVGHDVDLYANYSKRKEKKLQI